MLRHSVVRTVLDVGVAPIGCRCPAGDRSHMHFARVQWVNCVGAIETSLATLTMRLVLQILRLLAVWSHFPTFVVTCVDARAMCFPWQCSIQRLALSLFLRTQFFFFLADAVAKRYRPWPKGLRADSLPWLDSPLVQGASRLRYTDKAQVAATGPYWPKGARNKKNFLRTQFCLV